MSDSLLSITTEIEERLERLSSQLGHDAIQELLEKSQLYLEQAHRELVSSLMAEDWHKVARQAHQLKGASVLFGNTQLSALVARLQRKPRPIESHQVLLDELEVIVAMISQILQSKYDQKSPEYQQPR